MLAPVAFNKADEPLQTDVSVPLITGSELIDKLCVDAAVHPFASVPVTE